MSAQHCRAYRSTAKTNMAGLMNRSKAGIGGRRRGTHAIGYGKTATCASASFELLAG
jgi:hypothetical protein